MLIEIYSDGSSDGKSGGVGGWGFVVVIDGIKVYEESGSDIKATNNSMEITGALRGLEHVARTYAAVALKEVVLLSDSQLVLGYATGRYRCKAMHLLPLYLQLRKVFNQLNAKDTWVKGHSGNVFNEQCDRLAKAQKQIASIGPKTDSVAKET